MNLKKIIVIFFALICVLIPNNKVRAFTDESKLEPDPTNGKIYYEKRRSIEGKGEKLLGKWRGLTYYSQADKRWAKKIYTSTNNKNQTMKSSGCGPTCGAMIVSSSKGEILPTVMAKIAVEHDFRTKSNGTSWNFFPFIADYFDFKEYYTTTNFEKAMKYLKQKNEIGESKYYIVVSCGKGVFTSSGHYVVLASLDNGKIEVLDSYLYSGKFNTPTRKKANVELKGNYAYISEKKFKKYANYRRFWIYSNDKGNEQKRRTSKAKYTRYVKVNTRLNIRKGPSTKYKIVGKLRNGEKVKVYETKNGFSKIGNNKWVSSKYLSNKKTSVKSKVGQIEILKKSTIMYSKSNLSGKKYYYKKNTRVKVLKNISSKVDYIRVVVTGRKGYIKISDFR